MSQESIDTSVFVYHFDHSSGELIFVSEAFEDPLETRRQGHPVYMLPADATFETPHTAPEGYVNVWDRISGSWYLTQDLRGTEYWLSTDTWEAYPKVWDQLGPLPRGTRVTKPEKPYEVALSENMAVIRTQRDRLISDVMWRVERYTTQRDAGITTTDSAETYLAILKYIQDLRDITGNANFPWNGNIDAVPWPVLSV